MGGHLRTIMKKENVPIVPCLLIWKKECRTHFGDWYDAKTGIIEQFFNCSVQGGVFVPLLKLNGIRTTTFLVRNRTLIAKPCDVVWYSRTLEITKEQLKKAVY